MRTVRVLKPIQSIEEVQASLDTFGDRIVAKLDGRHSTPPAEGDALSANFSYGDVFDDLAGDLESLRVKVVGAEDEHVRRSARTAVLRREIDEVGSDLYDQQVAARRILGGAYDGDRTFELAAVSGDTPRRPKALEEQVDQTVKLLRDPVVEPPSVTVPGVNVDLPEVAAGLETTLKSFRAKRSDLDRARKGVGESKVLLDQVLDEFQGSFPWIAQALEAFARMVGERELADRIRTSLRRVTRRQGEEEEASDPIDSGDPATEEAAPSEPPSEEAAATETPSPETASEEAISEESASDSETADDTA